MKKEVGPNPLMRQFNHLKLIEGVLHRVTTVDEEEKCQLVLVRKSIQTNSSGDVVVMLTRGARCMVDDFLLTQRPHSSIQVVIMS
jgi:regulator of RNase E activity RraA